MHACGNKLTRALLCHFYLHTKQPNTFAFLHVHFAVGNRMDEFKQDELPAVSVSITRAQSQPQIPHPPSLPPLLPSLSSRSSTRESRVQSSAQTWNDNANSSNQNTLRMQSSPTLVPASTSNVTALTPYWNSQAEVLSRRLWLPTETGSVASLLNSSRPSSGCMAQKSWFSFTTRHRTPESQNLPTICLPSTQSSFADDKENEPPNTEGNTKKRKNAVTAKTARKAKIQKLGELNRALQLKMYPNALQKTLMKKWMGASRFAYNTVIDWARKRRIYSKDTPIGPAFKTWLKHVPATQRKADFLRWDGEEKTRLVMEEAFCRRMVALKMRLRGIYGSCPDNIRDEATAAALKTRAQVISVNMSRDSGRASRSGFKSRKALVHTMDIRRQNFSKKTSNWNKFYVSYLHSNEMYESPRKKPPDKHGTLFPGHFEKKRKNNVWPMPHKITSDCKLSYRRLTDEWIFTWNYEKDVVVRENQAAEDLHVVSIDPGVRTPFTWYSPSKGAGKVGHMDKGRLMRLGHHLDVLISRMAVYRNSHSKRKNKKAQRMRHAAARMRRQIHRLQTEIHRKSALFFVKEFDVIVIPPFNAHEMSRRGTRKIQSPVVRSMMDWGHGLFRQRLISKAQEYGKTVVIQNEAYTTKTCSWCGNRQNVDKVYRCKGCNNVIDRDVNGARGILLRALLDGALVVTD